MTEPTSADLDALRTRLAEQPDTLKDADMAHDLELMQRRRVKQQVLLDQQSETIKALRAELATAETQRDEARSQLLAEDELGNVIAAELMTTQRELQQCQVQRDEARATVAQLEREIAVLRGTKGEQVWQTN